jgi:uncharacterized hydrophobic protein (TIGR00271 family)
MSDPTESAIEPAKPVTEKAAESRLSHSLVLAISNQSSVEDLTALASLLAQAEQDRILLLNLGGNEEGQAALSERIDTAVAQLAAQGLQARAVLGSSAGAVRNVLDIARETNARLIILGARHSRSSQEGLGTLVENVVAAATCPVLIYRLGTPLKFTRVLVPARSGEPTRLAIKTGLHIAAAGELSIEAIYIRGSDETDWEARVRLEATLDGIEGRGRLGRIIDTHRDPVRGIFSHAGAEDLLLAGYTRRNEVERWFYGAVSQALLSGADGPVLLVAGPQGAPVADNRWQRLLQWIRPTLTPFEQDELVSQAGNMARPSLDYIVLISVAAILASFGLLANSGAVIIGAMLVAPLMAPLIAFAVGITIGRLGLVERALGTVLQGFLIAFGLPWLIGFLFTSSTLMTPEMAARGNPTIIDLGVAVASGFIAAYATARKHIPAALAGVAIAAALVPPICTSGLGLAMGNMALFWGAGILFVTNVVSIILAAWLTFFFLGMRPPVVEASRRRQYISSGLVATFIVLAVSLYALAVNPASEQRIEEQLRTTLRSDELINVEVRRNQPLEVIATIRRSSERLTDNSEILLAENRLEASLNRNVILSAVVQPLVSKRTVILDTLESGFAPATVVDMQLMEPAGEPLLVEATIRGNDPASIQNQAATTQRALARVLEEPVELVVSPQLPVAGDLLDQISAIMAAQFPADRSLDLQVYAGTSASDSLIVVIDRRALGDDVSLAAIEAALQEALGRDVQVEIR